MFTVVNGRVGTGSGTSTTRRRHWLQIFLRGLVVLIAAALIGVFSVWLDRSDFVGRAQRAVARFMPPPATQVVPWLDVATHYHQLQVAAIRVSRVTATGGSIAELDDHILIASPQGRFSFLDPQYQLHPLPFRTRMNIEGLRNDPLYDDPRFQVASLRTHDLLAIRTAAGRYDLYASFDRFSGQCIDFVISRIRLRVDRDGVVPIGRWTDIWTADPCLRFKDRGSLLEGWQQGGRMVQKSVDAILVSVGDYQRDGFYDSQAVSMDPGFDHGKLIEVNVQTGAARRVAVGLRNPQGLATDAQGRVWETEHGPQGGDEINLLVEGRNYGWPVVTFGMNYGSPPTPWRSTARVGSNDVYERPRFAFVPSIGISNLAVLDSREFPNWVGSLLVCSLRGKSLYVVKLVGDDVVLAEPISMGHRLRDIAVLRNGRLALLADGGVLLLLRNAASAVGAEREFVVSGLSSLPPPSEEEAPGAGLTAAARGRAYFTGSCATCHSISGEIGIGPPLDGVVDRPVASVASFGYSNALARLGGVWTERRLANFIHYPESVAPGSTMPASGLHDLESADVVAYLKTLPGGRLRATRN